VTGHSRAASVSSVADMIDFLPGDGGGGRDAKQRLKANAERVYDEMKVSETV